MNRPSTDFSPEHSRARLVQGLVAFCLLCLLLAVFSGIGWLEARKEAQTLQTELQLTQSSLAETRQQLEAEQLISRRELEMLRVQQNSQQRKP